MGNNFNSLARSVVQFERYGVWQLVVVMAYIPDRNHSSRRILHRSFGNDYRHGAESGESMTDFTLLMTCISAGFIAGGTIALAKAAVHAIGR